METPKPPEQAPPKKPIEDGVPLQPPAVHTTVPMPQPAPVPAADKPADASPPDEERKKPITEAQKKKLGREARRLYLFGIGTFNRRAAERCRNDREWCEDADEVLSDILYEDFGLVDLKEARYVRAALILGPPIYECAFPAKAPADKKPADTEKKTEKPPVKATEKEIDHGDPGQGRKEEGAKPPAGGLGAGKAGQDRRRARKAGKRGRPSQRKR